MYLPDPASQSLGGGVRRECRCRRTGRWDRRCAVQSSPSLLTVQRTWNLPLLDEAFDSCCQSGFCTIFAILSTPSRVCFATRARAGWCRSYEWARLRTAPTGMEKELPRLHTSLRTRGCRRGAWCWTRVSGQAVSRCFARWQLLLVQPCSARISSRDATTGRVSRRLASQLWTGRPQVCCRVWTVARLFVVTFVAAGQFSCGDR